MLRTTSLGIGQLRAACETGEITPRTVVRDVLAAIEATRDANPAWIHVLPRTRCSRGPQRSSSAAQRRAAAALRRAFRGQGQHRRRRPADDRGVSRVRLRAAGDGARCRSGSSDAGAILIGKTNMDQFATGLVGTRSPYGACCESVRPALYLRRLELGLGGGGRARAM